MEESFIQSILEQAKFVLERSVADNSSFLSAVAVTNSDGSASLMLTPWSDWHEKKFLLQNVGEFIAIQGHFECLVITDGTFADTDIEEVNRVKENWETEKPSMLPKDERREALILSAFNFKDPTQDRLWFAEYFTTGPNVTFTGLKKITGSTIDGEIKEFLSQGFVIGVAAKFAKEQNSSSIFGAPQIDEEFFIGLKHYINTEYPGLVGLLR
jgi:hypothetical protein